MERPEILRLILDTVENTNPARPADQQLAVSESAPLFGPGSPLDSIGLVTLLIDIEDAFRDRGRPIVLSDDRAMSRKRSPFRDVASLADYIATLTDNP